MTSRYKRIVINGKSILEHRYIMQQYIGRELHSYEQVHHINGNRFDNQIENLMIVTQKEHDEIHKWKYSKTKHCVICGKEFRKRKYKGKERKYCSTRCAGIGKSPIWKYNGESLHVVEWEEKTGINAKCLLNRKDMGWDIEKILTTPISEKRGGKIDNP